MVKWYYIDPNWSIKISVQEACQAMHQRVDLEWPVLFWSFGWIRIFAACVWTHNTHTYFPFSHFLLSSSVEIILDPDIIVHLTHCLLSLWRRINLSLCLLRDSHLNLTDAPLGALKEPKTSSMKEDMKGLEVIRAVVLWTAWTALSCFLVWCCP